MKAGTITVTIGDDGSMLFNLKVDELDAEEAGKICSRLCKQFAMAFLKENPDLEYGDILGAVIDGFTEELQSDDTGVEVPRILNG